MMKKRNIGNIIIPFVRLGFFLLQPALFSTAFTGVKNIITSMASQASLEWNSFTQTLLALVIVTILFGRIFCGFACAFGTYGDFLYYISSAVRKKCKKKPFHIFGKYENIMKCLKYVVLIAVLALCACGMSGLISENSPWTVFSRIQTMHLPASVYGVVLFVLISLGMLLEPRFFCRFLCPMGAVFSMLPVLPAMRIKRKREACIPGCSLCQRNCPAGIEIPDANAEDSAGMGECFACGKCMRGCPKKNIYVFCANDKKSQ
jgi:polyferredoxin